MEKTLSWWDGWNSFCRVQMEETLYVEYLMEETLSAGVYNRVNTFSVSVMEETLYGNFYKKRF